MAISPPDYKQILIDKQSSKAGSWRQKVEACKHVTCPLFKHRPTSKGAK
jgi:hypothetical protein